MKPVRKPFEGIGNIIKFNWHFYALAAGMVFILLLFSIYTGEPYAVGYKIAACLIIAITIVSLAVSFYVYDGSDLYKLSWLDEIAILDGDKIVNIHAGFDETSKLLHHKFPQAEISVFDFYDPLKHTEVSIKRARKAYPAFKNTLQVNTSHLPLPDNYADDIFLILAAHEIRNEEERVVFFNQLKRVLKTTGNIVVVEHLRDIPNFLAYNMGFFHFVSKSSWYKTFEKAGLTIYKENKITPFITIFTLKQYGTSA